MGPAPVLSISKFRFYACLVDDFSKYTWIIPLKNKSNIFAAYLAFEKYVERQLNKKIKIFHSDGGGVNSRLASHFLATEVVHQISCPYTLEQTGMVERRHRIIRELGMTMLFHSHAPLYLWLEAFSTVVFLLNRLPSSSLNFETPYFMLHGTHPDYTSLQVFGSKCFPYTWDTKNTKFDPKSALCIFVGYSEKHKVYKWFHSPSQKFIISRHVVFDETFFPFQSSKSSISASHVHHILYSWLPSYSCSESSTPLQESTSLAHSHISLTLAATILSPSDPTLPSNSRLVEPPSTSNSLTTSSEPHDPLTLGDTMTAPIVPSTSEPMSAPAISESQSSPAPVHHPMTTRSQHGIVKPNPKYALTIDMSSTIPREPKTIKTTLSYPGWKTAMFEELAALHQNETWRLVPHTPNMHVIDSKWVFKTKLRPNGTWTVLKLA